MKLSEGILETIMTGTIVQEAILQVLAIKRINSGTDKDRDRYRFVLSDGIHSIHSAIVTPKAYDKLQTEGIPVNSIIRVNKYVTNVIKTMTSDKARVIVILDMDLISKTSEVIGNPEVLANSNQNIESDRFSSENLSLAAFSGISFPKNIHPIASLNPYHNGWTIKARISHKSLIRTWANSQGEGKFFTVNLIDASGEVRCTFFKELAEKFYDSLQINKLYYVSKCVLKPKNRQFCNLIHPFEMSAVECTAFELCLEEDDAVPRVKFDFVPFDKILSMEAGTLVDVVGICHSISDLQTFTSKSTNRELIKRDISLVDQSKIEISLTLWFKQAEAIIEDLKQSSAIVVKDAKISHFGGCKSLSTVFSSQLKINPDIPEAVQMQVWYNLEGKQIVFKNVSSGNNFGYAWMSFAEAQEKGFSNEKGLFYQTMATILLIRAENCVYKACPIPDCLKKVVDLQNGMFRCAKCNKEYSSFKYRFIMNLNCCDSFSTQWVTMFASEAEKIIGRTAEEIGLEYENGFENVAKIFEEVYFKHFIFKCRVQQNIFNDEQRLKTVVIQANPVNYEEYGSYLVEKINNFIS